MRAARPAINEAVGKRQPRGSASGREVQFPILRPKFAV